MTDSVLVPLQFLPGISRDRTDYDNKGRWYDCNWVRFRGGKPEKMGGWEKMSTDTITGYVRSLTAMSTYHDWDPTVGFRRWLVIGTSSAFYLSDETDIWQLTPYRGTQAVNNGLSTTSGSNLLTVAATAHGVSVGDLVGLSGFTTIDGYTDVYMASASWAVATVPNANTFTLNMINNATSTVASAGGSGTLVYYTTLSNAYWSQDNFGLYLVANLRDQELYYRTQNSFVVPIPANSTLLPLTSIGSASDVPVVSRVVAVSAEESHCIAFGCNILGDTDQDPMFVRWSDTESLSNWTPSITNTAGGYRLSIGNEIICVKETRTEILIWTDAALYSMRWVGGQYVFSFVLLGNNTSIIGLNASCATNDFVAWMGHEQFFIYDGRIRPIECPISDYIFTSLNDDHLNKIYAFTNNNFNEVGWLIPTGAATEPDKAVIYNYKDNVWYYGSISRTAWLDRGAAYAPVAGGTDGYIYYQETGLDNGSTSPASAIEAFIESSPVEISEGGDGMNYMFVDRMIPDITFRNSSAAEPTATMRMRMYDYPGAAAATSQDVSSTVEQTVSMAVGEFTEQCWMRLRGRSLVFKCSSNEVGVTWRLGAPRISVRQDGKR